LRYVADPLVFLARYVDMIEVNSSFYRVPSARTTSSWAARAAHQPGFFFTAKLFKGFTHESLQSPAAAEEFRSALAPLRERGLLRGILAQFRYDFSDTPEARRQIAWMHTAFAALAPLIIEVRHKSWEADHALGFFRDLGVTVAHLDYPTARDSFNPYTCAVGEQAYLRLHGRNRQAWFSPEATVAETYNYDYSDAEIAGLAERSRSILGHARELTIVANNHYQGKAVSAALRLKAELTHQKVPVPPALLETYPGLRRIASPVGVAPQCD
jgi:uncharacterized protein YecE (DUF72 family)